MAFLVLLLCIFHMKSKFGDLKGLRSLIWFLVYLHWMLKMLTLERLLQVLFKMLSKEIPDEAFSFTSYNTEYYDLILKLAGHYPHSTVLHLMDEDPTTAKSQYESARKANLSNLVIGSLKLDHMFASKLVQSPDFFRYQFIGMHYDGIFNFQFIKYNRQRALRVHFITKVWSCHNTLITNPITTKFLFLNALCLMTFNYPIHLSVRRCNEGFFFQLQNLAWKSWIQPIYFCSFSFRF